MQNVLGLRHPAASDLVKCGCVESVVWALYYRIFLPARAPPPVVVTAPGGGAGDGMGSDVAPASFSSLSFSKDRSVMKGQRSSVLRWRLILNSSSRVKLLLVFCLLLLSVFLTTRASSFMGWRHQRVRPHLLTPRHRYTVLMNTWRRNDLLKKSVAHYAKCGSVDAIRVIWSERDPPPEALHVKLLESVQEADSSNKIDFRFNLNEEDDLNNRFKPVEGLRTDAVFSIDDDVVVPCSTLEFAFSVWRSAPDSMVGFVPRMHWLETTKHGFEQYTYGGWWSVWWMGTYSMVLTKSAFFHKKYLEMYTNEMPTALLSYVKNERNCEDIAMSFMVANATSAPPVWVEGRIFEIGSTGISSLKGHSQHRTACLNEFVRHFGYMPLVGSHVKAVDASHTWLW